MPYQYHKPTVSLLLNYSHWIPGLRLKQVSSKIHQGDLPDSVHGAAGEQSHLLTTLSVTAAVDVTHILVLVTRTQPVN